MGHTKIMSAAANINRTVRKNKSAHTMAKGIGSSLGRLSGKSHERNCTEDAPQIANNEATHMYRNGAGIASGFIA
jgi:hypothetical protein